MIETHDTNPRADRVHVFKDKAGEWRWRRRATNGRIIATSGDGYVNHSHALKMAVRLNPDAELLDDLESE